MVIAGMIYKYIEYHGYVAMEMHSPSHDSTCTAWSRGGVCVKVCVLVSVCLFAESVILVCMCVCVCVCLCVCVCVSEEVTVNTTVCIFYIFHVSVCQGGERVGGWDPRSLAERCPLCPPEAGGGTTAHQKLEVQS